MFYAKSGFDIKENLLSDKISDEMLTWDMRVPGLSFLPDDLVPFQPTDILKLNSWLTELPLSAINSRPISDNVLDMQNENDDTVMCCANSLL